MGSQYDLRRELVHDGTSKNITTVNIMRKTYPIMAKFSTTFVTFTVM